MLNSPTFKNLSFSVYCCQLVRLLNGISRTCKSKTWGFIWQIIRLITRNSVAVVTFDERLPVSIILAARFRLTCLSAHRCSKIVSSDRKLRRKTEAIITAAPGVLESAVSSQQCASPRHLMHSESTRRVFLFEISG